jgi:hypothetical protein
LGFEIDKADTPLGITADPPIATAFDMPIAAHPDPPIATSLLETTRTGILPESPEQMGPKAIVSDVICDNGTQPGHPSISLLSPAESSVPE